MQHSLFQSDAIKAVRLATACLGTSLYLSLALRSNSSANSLRPAPRFHSRLGSMTSALNTRTSTGTDTGSFKHCKAKMTTNQERMGTMSKMITRITRVHLGRLMGLVVSFSFRFQVSAPCITFGRGKSFYRVLGSLTAIIS